MIRKSKYYHRNLSINKKGTNIKIIRIKNYSDILKYLVGVNTQNDKVCYLSSYLKGLNTIFFNSQFDIVIINKK